MLGRWRIPLTLTVGRASVHNVVLADDNEVSGDHCKIVDRSGHFFLIDTSTNGTRVNGKKVKNEIRLHHSDPEDIAVTDAAILELFPEKKALHRWIKQAQERIHFQGLPARICWLEYGERARAGLAFNQLVREGKVSAPIVIGRDHLDTGSVASPNRETEAMRDGSDAIADWPLLNAMLNTACGASWVSLHHGGGVGIGYSMHAGMVCVADGSEAADRRLERVLTADPGTGVMRHADAGYEDAIETANERGVDLPMINGG